MDAFCARLAETHAACFEAPRHWSAAMIEAQLLAAGCMILGDPDSFLIGRVTVDEAEVLTLATHPLVRRKGHARALLAAFETIARARGAQRVFLEVAENDTAARALYLAAGYAPAGRRPRYYLAADGTRCDALVLRKSLAAA